MDKRARKDVRIQYRRKSDSFLMGVLGRIFGDHFLTSYWTTIGSTIYPPTIYDKDEDWGTVAWEMRHLSVVRHELVHVRQFQRLGFFLMLLLYVGPSPFLLLSSLILMWFTPFFLFPFLLSFVLAPLTVGFAWGRWYVEREAYATQISSERDAVWVANKLWDDYLRCWPKQWSYNWFMNNLNGS